MATLPVSSIKGVAPFALHRKLGFAGGVREYTLTGAISLINQNEDLLRLDPGGAHRDVTLPSNASSKKGTFFLIYNSADAAENLVIKTPAAATLATLGQGESGLFAYTGTAWKVLFTNDPTSSAQSIANTWALLQTYTTGVLLEDNAYVDFSTGDMIMTADGTDVIVTGTGDLIFVDSFDVKFGTGADIGVTWDGTSLKVSQAAPNSAIQLGVDGAGIDLILLGDTASAACTWDQSADSLILSGVAKIKCQTIAAATGTAIPVTHSGSFPVTSGAASTNTLADPSFIGQWISIFVDTDGGAHVITAASRINQAANTVITLTEVGDFIKLEAITIGGALKWQVVANDGAVLA